MTINLEKSMDINASIQDVFRLWMDPLSASRLLPSARDASIELIEHLENQRLSWKITGPEVAGTATVVLAPSGEDHLNTKVTFTAHYPNGLGASTTLHQVTSDMENGLANVARHLSGEASLNNETHVAETSASSLYPEVTESAEVLYQTWKSATEAWAKSVNKSFEIMSSLAWLPLQVSSAKPALQGSGS
jgi:hypothetical protein